MADRLPEGPYRTLRMEDGTAVSWYIMPFDKAGICTGPRTRDHLIDELSSNDYTDVYLFSHGWNNAWAEASGRYQHFIDGFVNQGKERDLALDRPYRPLLVGVFWPSAILVLPWERGPLFAGADTEIEDHVIGLERDEVQEVAEQLNPDNRTRFYELAQRDEPLDQQGVKDLAGLLAPLYATEDDEVSKEAVPPDANELIEVWREVETHDAPPDDDDDFGTVTDRRSGPMVAGGVGLWGRDIVRATTVRLMKDRAGTVGARGVAPLLEDMSKAQHNARFHLVGHSYGCKVLLSAIRGAQLPRAVNSLLLLQPAVNHLCFASDATGDGRPGGYRQVLGSVEQPILSTFSAHDAPLTRFFHLALRRAADLGEQRIAGAPPSRYAALGGFGPGGLAPGEATELPAMPNVGESYGLNAAHPEILGLNATNAIKGHGDISNPWTWWALRSQVAV